MTFPKETSRASGRKGVSIRTLSILLLIVTILAIIFSLLESQRTMRHAESLYSLEQERQKCDRAIQQFMDGSDYLTNQIQLFVVKGDRDYMDSYWAEVYETQSRDKALETILTSDITPEERVAATNGKAESDELIQGEIWAMRMISESVGIADLPPDVAQCRLLPADAALSAEAKQQAAIAYIFGPEYSMAKSVIRNNVNVFRNKITNRHAEEALAALAKTRGTAIYMSTALTFFMLVLLAALLCFMLQVVRPLIQFANRLTAPDSGQTPSLLESGALEIRQFAKAFNNLSLHVEQNTQRLERLGYIDFLTEVPNRASITEYVSDLIEKKSIPLGLMIVDIDNFKRFNDTYGHALGDKVLKCVAQAVCAPAKHGISGRLCGEEFIVSQQNATEENMSALAECILQNVRQINSSDVELSQAIDFHITVSIGGVLWQDDQPMTFEKLLSKADQALYVSKRNGKNEYTLSRGITEKA